MLSYAWKEGWQDHWREKIPWKGLIAVAFTFFLYSNLFKVPFLLLGDPEWILTNPFVENLDLIGALTLPLDGLFQPIPHSIWVSLAAFSQGVHGELLPPYFHGVSLFLHLGNVLLVYLILSRWIDSDWGSFVAALLFGIHPLQVEAVSWASQLPLLVGFCCVLLSLYTHLRYLERSSRVSYWASFLFLVMALLSHPATTVGIGFLFLASKILSDRGWKEIAHENLPHMIAVLFLTTVQLFIRIPMEGLALSERPMAALFSLSFYLKSLVWPINTNLDHTLFLKDFSWTHVDWIAPGLLATLIFFHKKPLAKGMLHGIALLLLGIVPFLGLLTLQSQEFSIVSDRYTYFALFGFSFVIGWAFAQFEGWQPAQAVTGISFFGVGFCAFLQVEAWETNETLFTKVIERNPKSYLAHHSLGEFYEERRSPEKALFHYKQAYALRETWEAGEAIAKTHHALGQLELARQMYEEAGVKFSRGELLHEAGKIYWHFGDYENAERLIARAVKVQPANKVARENLASLQSVVEKQERLASLRLETDPSGETSATLHP